MILRNILILLTLTSSLYAHAFTPNMPVMVLPYYHFEFPTINVGKPSRKLADDDSANVSTAIMKLKKRPKKLTIEQEFVAAVRLFDMGDTTAAIQWFYSASYRAKLFEKIADKSSSFEIQRAHVAFQKQIGAVLNIIAYKKPDRLTTIIQNIMSEQSEISFDSAYPDITFMDLEASRNQQNELNRECSEFINFLKSREP